MKRPRELFDVLQPERWRVERIVSGGQTGVDRAALDAAIELAIPHGGWCPRGRKAEDGCIPTIYDLAELDSDFYADRSRRNVDDTDGTMILFQGKLEGGTLLTARYAAGVGKPCHRVRLDGRPSFMACGDWLSQNEIRTLNIAGPRSSKDPAVYDRAKLFLLQLFG